MQLQSGEKACNLSKKKFRPILNKAGRIQKKYELGWRNISPGPRSTSPDSPVHGGAAAKPMQLVSANPMYEYLEGWKMDNVNLFHSFCSRVRALGEHM